jgi:hypothetical protein
MLLNFSAKNFHSFAEKVEISFRLNKRDSVFGWDRATPSGQRVTSVLAVLGPNGAGKTTLIKIGPFLAWFIRDSFALHPDAPIPMLPHLALGGEPSEFETETEGVSDGFSWRYKLTATPERVIHESLHRKSHAPGERWSYLFTRQWNEGARAYEVKQQGFGLIESEAQKVRQNVSFISWARQYGVETAIDVSDFVVASNVNTHGLARPGEAALFDAADYFRDNQAQTDQMRTLLKSWDLGLTDVDFHQFDSVENQHTAQPQKRWFPMGKHSARGNSFSLPFWLESSGTQAAFLLLWRLLPVLSTGGVAFIDELEGNLHPHMIEPLLRLFHDEATNPRQAQLVFTCQSPEVLRILQRAQVLFVEKVDCESLAYRGDTIAGLESSHNLYAKYNSGALGAVPQL